MGKPLLSKPYDPPAAVVKATSALLAMTALDAANLGGTFTVPAGGAVMVRIRVTHHGTATTPGLLFGVLEGSTVRGRMPPDPPGSGTQAATTLVPMEVLFPVVGLTPGASLTWAAAYSVETLVTGTGTGLKYGGPNDGGANNGFGMALFEVWEP